MADPITLYHKPLFLQAREVDFAGAWRPRAIFQAIQEAAEEHATALGAGYEKLLKQRVVWVLSRGTVQMKRTPQMHEHLTLTTWPGETRHGYFPRYVRFSDANGSPVGQAAFLWVLMNLDARQMVLPEQLSFEMLTNGEEPLPCETPGRLRAPSLAGALSQKTEQFVKTPCYCDLDVNGHVNNTVYLDWLCERLPLAFHQKWRMVGAQVNYNEELVGEQPAGLALLHQETENGGRRITLWESESRHPKFLLQTDWIGR